MKTLTQRLNLLALSVLTSTATATGTVFYVNVNSANPTPPYMDWSTAAKNIQDAVDASTDGDLILVTNGVYQTGGSAMRGTNRVAVTKAVTVQSVNGPAVTIIQGYQIPGVTNGDAAVRCAYLTNGATLAGFTLTNGATQVSFSGGGVDCESYLSSIVTNCVLVNNSAFALAGGASGGTLYNCKIIGNQPGGATAALLINCMVLSNSAAVRGGGADGCQLYNCTVSGNQALQGGGANNSDLVNCLVFGNLATQNGGSSVGGGGAYQSTLYNCTVVGNTAAVTSCGGTYNSTMYNCIVYYNSAFSSPNYNGASLYYCCTSPAPSGGVGNIASAPSFVNQTTGNFHLQASSPCINSGNNAYTSGAIGNPGFNDLDGNARTAGGTVDIGAYEFQSPASRISYAWLQQYNLPINNSTDLLDTDGDGMDNWQEWRSGTNPTNPLSVLKMLAPSNNVAGVAVPWQSVSGIMYYLQRSTNLAAPSSFSTIQSNITGKAGTTTLTDTNATETGPFFYRVGVQ